MKKSSHFTVALAALFLSIQSFAQPCATAGGDTLICGFSYLLEPQPPGGVWQIICSLSDGGAAFSGDSGAPIVTVASCGEFHFQYIYSDGVCVTVDTVQVLFDDPSAATFGAYGDASLGYLGLGCHSGAAAPPCSNTATVGGENPPEVGWEFCTTSTCSTLVVTPQPGAPLSGCQLSEVTLNTTLFGSPTIENCYDYTQEEVLSGWFDIIDSLTQAALDSILWDCPLPPPGCYSPTLVDVDTVWDTVTVLLPHRIGGHWTYQAQNGDWLDLMDTTGLIYNNLGFLLVVAPGADYYGPGDLSFTLWQDNSPAPPIPPSIAVSLQLQWEEDWIYDTLTEVKMRIVEDYDGVVCGGVHIFLPVFAVPPILDYPCGHITISFGPVNCTNCPASVQINGNPLLTCIQPCTPLFASSSTPGTYQWSNGSTSSNSYTCSPGLYSVTVTSACGCTSEDGMFVSGNFTPPVVSIAPPATISCNNPCVTLTASYSPPFSTAIWSNSSVGQSINVCSPGSYAVTVTNNFNGCTKAATVVVPAIFDPVESIEQTTICAGETYVFNGQQYSSSGTYQYSNTNGCLIYTLQLTVLPPVPPTYLNIPACEGDEFEINGQVFNQANPSGTVTLTNWQGCDSIFMVSMNFMPTTYLSLNVSICPGECYDWNGTNYCDIGTYILTGTGTNGCSLVSTLNLSEGTIPGASGVSDTLVCGFSYQLIPSVLGGTWGIICDMSEGVTAFSGDPAAPLVTVSGCGTYHFEYTFGDSSCLSVDTVHIQFEDPSTASIQLASTAGIGYLGIECPSGGAALPCTNSISVNGGSPPSVAWEICFTGQCNVTLVSPQTGATTGECTAADLNLTTSTSSSIPVSLCVEYSQEELLSGWFDILSSLEGDALGSVLSACPGLPGGCFPTVVTAMDTIWDTITVVLPYRVGGRWAYLDSGGVYVGLQDTSSLVLIGVEHLLTVSPGADYYGPDDLLFNLWEINAVGDTVMQTTQVNLQLKWQEEWAFDTLTQVQMRILTETEGGGCGGAHVVLSGFAMPTAPDFPCPAIELEFPPVNCNTCSTCTLWTESFFINCVNWCASISANSNCGGTYQWSNGESGQSIFVCEPGVYSVTLTTADGCVYSNSAFVYEDFTPPSIYLPDTGLITCDNCVFLPLSVYPSYAYVMWEGGDIQGSTLMNPEVCEPGIYTVTVTNPDSGCTDTASITVSGTTTVEEVFLNEIICEGDTFMLNGVAYTTTGDYFQMDFNACIEHHLHLSVLPPVPPGTLDSTLCEGDFIELGGVIFDQMNDSGTVALQSWQGCDSLVQVSLAFNPVEYYSIQAEKCVGECYDWNGQSLCDPGDYVFTSTGTSGCEVVTVLTLDDLPLQESFLSQTLCEGESLSINGAVYDADTPTGTEALPAANGCDSLVHISLTFSPMLTLFEQASICPGECLDWNGQTLCQAGVFTQPTTGSNGCPALVELTLSELPPIEASLNETLCPGESILINGTLYDATNPSGTETFQTAGGCDSLLHISLTFSEISAEITATKSCLGTATGSLNLDVSTGGLEPYLFAIGGGAFQLEPLFEALAPGIHQLSVADAEGCLLELEAIVEAHSPLELEPVEPLHICGAEKVSLSPQVADAPDLPLSYLWGDGSSAESLNVTRAGSYTVSVSNGCEMLPQSFEIINDYETLEGKIFVPNVFSPNDDHVNDQFRAFAGVPLDHFEFRVFDRWGNAMFSSSNPGDGWDGHRQQDGKLMKPAVFAWFLTAKAETCKGKMEALFLKGDVTLLR